ncbi:hypothetical protein ISS37_01015 [candidate division KSB1 bacterium]|nr:hypothetical protein [candidate division KSB1 bacterium]
MHDYFKLIKLTNPGDFTITDLPDAQYAIYGWMDVDDNEHVNFDPPEPIGWYSSDYGRMEPITLTQEENTQVANIILREVRPFPDRELKTEHGALKRIRGYPVLHLWGTPVEMGYAHGYLIAPQIMDFFEFFTLEDEVGSATKYKEKIIPVLKSRITLTKDLRAELDAMIQGMRDSGTDLYIEPLSREIDWIDLLAINAYGEFWMSRLACTQCAFWGKATENSELEGGLITGRNMDGECDIRKTTVIDFLIFAFEPMGKKKWISFKWPGFIGTYSGINEDGVYCMLNYGSKKPGPITVNHTPVTFIMRAILEEVGPENMVEDAVKVIDHYRSSGGGSCGAPTVMFIAAPYRGQEYPAVVYEGNRFGGKVRYPDEPPTSSPFNIVGSNHFFKFGVSPDKLGKVFGQIPYYSTQWRVTVAINKAEAWARTNKPVGTKEVINLLQSVAHGTTEHSIIFRPNEMTFDVANDDLKFDKWDAPFLKWTTFHFDEIFGKGK